MKFHTYVDRTYSYRFCIEDFFYVFTVTNMMTSVEFAWQFSHGGSMY